LVARAGRWFLDSGIQEPGGGVARYYLADARRNKPVSTEITGYAASTFVYLHTLTRDPRHLEHALAAARFLARTAWRRDLQAMPFETEPTEEGLLAYFFDCGMIVRGLLATWRATGEDELLAAARAVGCSMARDFAAGEGEYHPILVLPEKRPLERDERWSRSAGCYQLKPAMAWFDLWEATGDDSFRRLYERALDAALNGYARFLPGHIDKLKVMDRLHAFCYFLEGLLPRASDGQCAAAMRDGIARTAFLLREIAPEFCRADVCAQLLRARIYADWSGVLPLDMEAAKWEANRLAEFHIADTDPQLLGGFWFGRRDGRVIPHASPVPGGFGVQALALWEQTHAGTPQAHRHLLI
jgi:hypothetical protein